MTNRKEMIYNVLKKCTFENRRSTYQLIRKLLLKDLITYDLAHTNIDGRGTDWSDNNIRYHKILKLWKKH